MEKPINGNKKQKGKKYGTMTSLDKGGKVKKKYLSDLRSPPNVVVNDAALSLSRDGNTTVITLCDSGRNWPCLSFKPRKCINQCLPHGVFSFRVKECRMWHETEL